MAMGLLRLIGLPVADWIPGASVLPDWYGLALCFTYLLQAVMSTALERRFEPRIQRMLFWIICCPLGFWALSTTTLKLALPRPRKGHTTRVSPDRSLR
jgi:biofilm PGA synthesis N-glycosyltransferase PgaC